MADDVSILSDETLLQICRVSQEDLEAMPALGDELRLARLIIPPPRSRHDGRLEHLVVLLASVLGKLSQHDLPIGYNSPGFDIKGWVERDALEQVAKQIVGMAWLDVAPDHVASHVHQAATESIRLGLLESRDYDAWCPGMSSGSGWRVAVTATPYGVAKARAMGKRQVDATAQSAASSPAVQRPAQDPPWARKVAQPDGRPAADAPVSKQSVPVSWQDVPAPHLPAGMEPFDKTLVEMLLRLLTMWASVDFERLTNTEEKALAHLVEAGLVEERVVATAWMDGFPQVAILRGRVTGDFKRKLLWESVQSVPEWLTKDGKTRGRYSFWYDVTEVRLTDAGETARHDWNSPKPSFVLAIVRGIGGSTRGISPDGVVKIEERKVETREKPPAPSDVRALLREGFALNRVPTSDEVDAGTAIASAKKVIGEPVERAISEVTRRNICDALRINNVQWAGRLSETEFLARLYDLDSMPSTDHRFRDVAGDIAQHRVANPDDWPDDWVYSDSRFDLTNGPDDLFLRFLCEMIHPLVRPDDEGVQFLVATFNTHLVADGWEIAKCKEISGKPIFGPRRTSQRPGRGAREAKAVTSPLGPESSHDQLADPAYDRAAFDLPEIDEYRRMSPLDFATIIDRWEGAIERLAQALIKGDAKQVGVIAGEYSLEQVSNLVRLAMEDRGISCDAIIRLCEMFGRVASGFEVQIKDGWLDEAMVSTERLKTRLALELDTNRPLPIRPEQTHRGSNGQAPSAMSPASGSKVREHLQAAKRLLESLPDLGPDDATGAELAYAENATIEYLQGRFGYEDEPPNWPRDWHECPQAWEFYMRKIMEYRAGAATALVAAAEESAATEPTGTRELAPVCSTESERRMDEGWLSSLLREGQKHDDSRLIRSFSQHSVSDLLDDCNRMIQCLAGFDTVFLMSPAMAKEQAQGIDDEWLAGFNHTLEILCLAAVSRSIDVEPFKAFAESAYAFWTTDILSCDMEDAVKRFYSPCINALFNMKRTLMVEIAGQGVLEASGVYEEEAAATDSQPMQAKTAPAVSAGGPAEAAVVDFPTTECYGELDIDGKRRFALRIFLKKVGPGQRKELCEAVLLKKQAYNILESGIANARRQHIENQFEQAREDGTPMGRSECEPPPEMSFEVEWTPDQLATVLHDKEKYTDLTKSQRKSIKTAVHRVRGLVKFTHDNCGLVSEPAENGARRSLIPLRLRKSGQP